MVPLSSFWSYWYFCRRKMAPQDLSGTPLSPRARWTSSSRRRWKTTSWRCDIRNLEHVSRTTIPCRLDRMCPPFGRYFEIPMCQNFNHGVKQWILNPHHFSIVISILLNANPAGQNDRRGTSRHYPSETEVFPHMCYQHWCQNSNQAVMSGQRSPWILGGPRFGALRIPCPKFWTKFNIVLQKTITSPLP